MITQNILKEKDLDQLYDWVDSLTLSRPKKNIARDFSDASMMAEVISYHYPKIVELHNYPPTNSVKSKLQNWITLNSISQNIQDKVLSKIGINLTNEDCRRISSCTPLAIEPLLFIFRKFLIENNKEKQQYQKQNFVDKLPQRQRQKQGITVKLQTSSKLQQLRQVLSLIKQKICIVERSIQRKDSHIRQLQQTLKHYTNEKI